MVNKMNKGLVKITSTLLISTFVLTGCGAGGDTVAKVNGQSISIEEYSKDYDIIRQRYEAQFGPTFFEQKGEEGKTMDEVLKENVLDKLVIEELIMQKAKEEKVLATEEEINEQIKTFKEMVGGKEGFEKFLETNQMTEEYFKNGIKKEITVEKYREHFIKNLKLSDKELKSHYDKNKEQYETIEASHILVETEEEAKEIEKELKGGADFGELAKKSIEPGAAERKGSLGNFTRGKMIPEFEKAAFALKVGEISGPVKTEYQPGQYGYHIIKVTDKKESFEDLKDDIKISLEDTKFEEHLQSLKEDAKIKRYMENTKKVGVKEDKKETEDKTKEADKKPEDKKETPDKEAQNEKK